MNIVGRLYHLIIQWKNQQHNQYANINKSNDDLNFRGINEIITKDTSKDNEDILIF